MIGTHGPKYVWLVITDHLGAVEIDTIWSSPCGAAARWQTLVWKHGGETDTQKDITRQLKQSNHLAWGNEMHISVKKLAVYTAQPGHYGLAGGRTRRPHTV